MDVLRHLVSIVTSPIDVLTLSFDATKTLFFSTALVFVVTWLTRYATAAVLRRLLPNRKRRKVSKIVQATSECGQYTFFFILGVRLLSNYAHMHSPLYWFSSAFNRTTIFPDIFTPSYTHDSSIKTYYLLYAGRYLSNFLSVLLEPRKKDFVAMQIHHLSTFVLVLLSYSANFLCIGSIIMVLLDMADPPLHAAKTFLYLGRTWWADRCFEVFAVSFFVTRIIFFGRIVWECWGLTLGGAVSGEVGRSVLGSNFLLGVLFLLQLYWFWLIAAVAVKQAKGGNATDTRSDGEDSDDGEEDDEWNEGDDANAVVAPQDMKKFN